MTSLRRAFASPAWGPDRSKGGSPDPAAAPPPRHVDLRRDGDYWQVRCERGWHPVVESGGTYWCANCGDDLGERFA